MNEFVLEIHNLEYAFDNRLLFSSLNFRVKEKTITSVVGSNGSGKTTLMKILGGVFFTENMIQVGNMMLQAKTLEAYKKKVAYVDYSSMKFSSSTIYDEIYSQMNFTKWSLEKKEKQVQKVLYEFNLNPYKEKSPSRLSKRNKVLLKLAKAFVLSPKVLVMEFDSLNLSKEDKNTIFDTLESYISKGLSVIFSTNHSDDVLYSDRMIVLHNGGIAIEGSTSSVLKKDSLLLKLGIELPFMVDLSLKLKFYEVLSKVYLDEEELVNTLWK